jgi:hypothetical protein
MLTIHTHTIANCFSIERKVAQTRYIPYHHIRAQARKRLTSQADTPASTLTSFRATFEVESTEK